MSTNAQPDPGRHLRLHPGARRAPTRHSSPRAGLDLFERPCRLAAALVLAGALVTSGAQAGQNTAIFDVNIRLDATPASCGTANVAGSSLAIVCAGTAGSGTSKVATNTAAPAGAYRVLTRREDTLGSGDAYGGGITTTAVRVLNVAGRQFIEMTVGW